MTDSFRPIQRARLATIFLSLCGIALSFVALQQHVVYVNGFATGPSFCHINEYFNCEAVNASEWSAIFGVPVASYGLFFYAVLLLGSVCATSSGRMISLSSWAGITLVFSAFASLLSLALFAVSEIFIGSLCLMCIGLYLVNFITFGCVWRAAWVGRLREGLRSGVVEFLRTLGITAGFVKAQVPVSPWRLRSAALLSAFAALVSVILPDVLYEVYAAREMAQVDPIEEWRSAPVTRFNLQTSGGAFGDYSKGDPSAPIQVVEFADYECPACKMMHGVLGGVLERYADKVFFVFKNYPLDQSCNAEMKRKLHEFACVAAFFSRCAGEQGKFWEANTILFLRDAEKGELTTESLITEGSKEIGVDSAAVSECMSSGRYREKINEDIKAGVEADLQGTPSVWINGKLVSQPSREVFERIFDSILEERGAASH